MVAGAKHHTLSTSKTTLGKLRKGMRRHGVHRLPIHAQDHIQRLCLGDEIGAPVNAEPLIRAAHARIVQGHGLADRGPPLVELRVPQRHEEHALHASLRVLQAGARDEAVHRTRRTRLHLHRKGRAHDVDTYRKKAFKSLDAKPFSSVAAAGAHQHGLQGRRAAEGVGDLRVQVILLLPVESLSQQRAGEVAALPRERREVLEAAEEAAEADNLAF